jgi:hypothetical protein
MDFLNNYLNGSLTQWNTTLLEELMVAQLVMQTLAVYTEAEGS